MANPGLAEYEFLDKTTLPAYGADQVLISKETLYENSL
jgi:hypothetical protein